MPGERVHKIRVSHGTAKRLRTDHFISPTLRTLQKRIEGHGNTLHLTPRDIRMLIRHALELLDN